MSSYNNITKIKYTDNASDLVRLNEYIIFQDDKAKRKYIVFKFTNNVTQQLLGLQFEVNQYNVDGALIEKSVVAYNKFLASAEEDFVPKAKLRVSYRCTSISIRLIQAVFDRFVWKEGEYEDNCYKFTHFYRDEQAPEGEEPTVGGEPKRTKKAKKEKPEKVKKQKKSKRPFILRDATRKNLVKFPAVFNALVFVVVITFSVASLIIFKSTTTTFTEGDYQLRTVSGQTVAISGYTGTDTKLVIPEKIGKYNVTKIDKGAFNKSEITSLTIECKLYIDTDAFVNCNALKNVSSTKQIEVRQGAFRNCASLTTINLPYALLEENAFINCGK